ncbi:FIST C-terminal domain-containing protein [Flectobacillus sp. DC10W]|uniref:FIST C-terminal domain-containing protein n=1 Tax=Flectobacillus longus TaxID=2984207 RepID=A0ABT6YQ74_9BACT|nr:FIST N-terminal domain-containing protein [Flectobacillus longus]MDI9865710.1 FIST C-terminal domain-containing protein [Flectobacillus longus]
MKICQSTYRSDAWESIRIDEEFSSEKAQLVIVFGERKLFEQMQVYSKMREDFPHAEIVINSTAGEIFNTGVETQTIVVTALQFEDTQIKTTQIDIKDTSESYQAACQLVEALQADDLVHIIVISDGSVVNGSALVRALNEHTSPHVTVTGGLAGDDDRFEKTLVGLNAEPSEGKIIGIGFYGNHLRIGHGTMGGWDVFGPEREITQSQYNVLYSIGGKPALELYKEYLGKYAKDLPGAALLFPLSMRVDADSAPVVRTILSIDEKQQSMTFAGEIPKGALIRFMKANFDNLLDASSEAAENALQSLSFKPELAILISCVGRRLVLGYRTEEELEAAREVFGPDTCITGFYSYGEISPLMAEAKCDLHNQTMTITTFTEI